MRVREGFRVTGGSPAHPLCVVGERGRRDRCTCCVVRPSSTLQDWGGGRGEDKPGVWRATIPKEAKPQPPSSAHTGLPTRSTHSTPPDHQEPPRWPLAPVQSSPPPWHRPHCAALARPCLCIATPAPQTAFTAHPSTGSLLPPHPHHPRSSPPTDFPLTVPLQPHWPPCPRAFAPAVPPA